jgi:DNA-binding transcriptional LysR family regulator
VDWDDLRHFLAAYRNGSLARAARELGCEYTTVGRRVAALEAALGTALFVRTPEGLKPTDAAGDLMPLAEQIEEATHAIARRAAGRDERIDGVVRLTCAEGFSTYIVDQLADLRARHPDLVVDIIADLRLLDLVRGEADIALRLSPTDQRDLITRTLAPMPWRMFASEAYVARRGVPSLVTDLRGHEVVGYDDVLAHVPGARWLAEHLDGATVVLRGNNAHAVRDAAAAGLGVAVLPHFFAAREPRLRPVADDILGSRTLTLVVHPALTQVARVRAVIDFLVEAVTRDRDRGLFG